ncbi:hypothetical protein [Actinoallomurus iriomotensis]|uniref:DUF3558 domain-containing protein n=1 Tax=Actinoallomurus iriomotensis TaxID=478107 RepID=A0A9W6RJ45_9ACTN|nr:hypothetical protein [Actinoallomurus iriomotensis]GLY76668.1 hypothetical protein Airi01_049350 [Actinoallomurus iriomotensis]
MSGRRRAARPARRRGRLVAAACAAAFVLVVSGAVAWVSLGGDHAHQPRSRDAGAESSPMSTGRGSDRDAVPSACDTLSKSVADKLAPGADRSATLANQSDEHSECAWSLYGSRTRQLSVELRALAATGGTSATDTAIRTFSTEWQADRGGKDLSDGVKVRDSRGVSGVGEQAYVVYTVDASAAIGEAVANARLANVLITVHYSGGDHLNAAGTPLSSHTASDGALGAARDIVSKLESHS